MQTSSRGPAILKHIDVGKHLHVTRVKQELDAEARGVYVDTKGQ